MAQPVIDIRVMARRTQSDTVRSSAAAALRTFSSSSFVRRTCSISVFVMVLGMVSPIGPENVETINSVAGLVQGVVDQSELGKVRHESSVVTSSTESVVLNNELRDTVTATHTEREAGRIVGILQWSHTTRYRPDVGSASLCFPALQGAPFGESSHRLGLHERKREVAADSVRAFPLVLRILIASIEASVSHHIGGVVGVAVARTADRLLVVVAVLRAKLGTISHGGRQGLARAALGHVSKHPVSAFAIVIGGFAWSELHRPILQVCGFDPHHTSSVLQRQHKARGIQKNYA